MNAGRGEGSVRVKELFIETNIRCIRPKVAVATAAARTTSIINAKEKSEEKEERRNGTEESLRRETISLSEYLSFDKKSRRSREKEFRLVTCTKIRIQGGKID